MAAGERPCDGPAGARVKNTVSIDAPVPLQQPLKPVLKRGALIAVANWQVILIQWTADSLFKLLLATPIVGGVFLVALVVGAEPGELVNLQWREMAATIVGLLLSHPMVLTAFLLSVAVVAVGGSLFVFLVKAGTVAVLVRGEREGGVVEEPPLHLDTLRRAAKFSPEFYIESARSLYPRYARLGLGLMAVYLASGSGYLALVFAIGLAGDRWGMAALVTAGFVAWIALVNLLYLLVQIVIAADDSNVSAALRRVSAFMRHEPRCISAVFLVVLVLVVVATGVSLMATAALGLIAFVPFVGLAVLPLQLLAWLFRGLVFQYLGLTSIGAYLTLYRRFAATVADTGPARAGRYVLDPSS